jgi:hypothetical protein
VAIIIVVHTPLQQKQAHFHHRLKLSGSSNGKQQKSFKTKHTTAKTHTKSFPEDHQWQATKFLPEKKTQQQTLQQTLHMI